MDNSPKPTEGTPLDVLAEWHYLEVMKCSPERVADLQAFYLGTMADYAPKLRAAAEDVLADALHNGCRVLTRDACKSVAKETMRQLERRGLQFWKSTPLTPPHVSKPYTA